MLARSPFRPYEALALLAAAIALLPACADIGQRPPVNRDRVVRTEWVEVVVPGAHAAVAQRGTKAELDVAHVCDIRPARIVNRRTRRDSFNETPGTDWLLVGAGTLAIGAGTILVVDASSTYEDDPSSRTYNETGPTKERAWGYSLVGAGALFVGIAFVDAIRANGVTTKRERVTLTGDPEQRGIRCKEPYANIEVRATAPEFDQIYDLGRTDARGHLVVDLDQAIPTSARLSPNTSRLEIRVGNHTAGTLDLGSLYIEREARAFQEADAPGCRKAERLNSCFGLYKFVEVYPDGPHAQEAKTTIAGSKSKIDAMGDDQLWARLPVDECREKEFETPEQILEVCVPIRAYLNTFPQGRHSTEAAQALKSGEDRARKVAEKIQRAAKAAEAREAAAARRKCVAGCRMGCSSRQFRDPDSCFSGCVESQCAE